VLIRWRTVWSLTRTVRHRSPMRLRRRRASIFVALEEDHWARKALGVKQRRTFTIECLVLRVRANQPIKVVRLELMGITRERGDIAHAIITAAAREHIVENECCEHSVAAALPPLITIRSASTCPRSARKLAPLMQSSTSPMTLQYFWTMQLPPAAFNPLHNVAAISADSKGPTRAR